MLSACSLVAALTDVSSGKVLESQLSPKVLSSVLSAHSVLSVRGMAKAGVPKLLNRSSSRGLCLDPERKALLDETAVAEETLRQQHGQEKGREKEQRQSSVLAHCRKLALNLDTTTRVRQLNLESKKREREEE